MKKILGIAFTVLALTLVTVQVHFAKGGELDVSPEKVNALDNSIEVQIQSQNKADDPIDFDAEA
ncbi:MAG: hypothetical protein ACR2MX_14115 [Cyclobacteriaceae bacterium]